MPNSKFKFSAKNDLIYTRTKKVSSKFLTSRQYENTEITHIIAMKNGNNRFR